MTTSKGITPSKLADQVSLEILVNNRPIKQHKHNKKVYVEGRKDSEYSILVKNDNNVPVYAVVSVDGLSVIDGKPASENSIGFLIDKKSSITVPGWLISEKEVAKFTFTEKKSSYNEKTSKKNAPNTGVIGCIIIAEKDDSKDWEKILKELKDYKKDWEDKKYVPYPVPQPYPIPYPVYPHPWDWDYYRPRRWWTPIYETNTIWYCGGGTGIAGSGGYAGNSLPTSGGIGMGHGSGYGGSLSAGAGSISNQVQVFGQFSTLENSGVGSLSVNDTSSDTYTSGYASCNNVNMSASIAPTANNISDEKLGTSFGDKTKMKKEVDLEKPFDIGDIIKSFVIYYDSRKNLEKLGISFEKKKVVEKDPNPFPASKFKFCKPPEDWS